MNTQSSDLKDLFAAQRGAHFADPVPSAAVRQHRIDRLILMLTENAQEFAAALAADFGNRPEVVNLVCDVAGILPDVLATRKGVAKWMRPRVLRSSTLMGMPTVVETRPLGVVGIIGPWNFPIGLVVQPTASALAAGNRVMVKFSEVTPRTAGVFAEQVARYFDPTELTVVLGGPEVGAQFSDLPFDHIFFTGSPGVGAKVAAAAARNLVPVTLELGGKNPAVVAEDADVAAAASRIMGARLVNGGQLCLCPEYAFVPSEKIDEFVGEALKRADAAAEADGGAGLVSIVDDRNHARVTALIDDARVGGAVVKQAAAGAHEPVRRIRPTVLLGVTDQMRISSEEVFGPVLAVYPYDSLDTVFEHVRAGSTPLAAYWYGPTGAGFDDFRRNVASGGMTVNDFAAHNSIPGAPFGGLGGSGWGAYHGKVGFDTFSHRRTITKSRLPKGLADFLAPPYPRGMLRGVRTLIALQRRAAARRLRRGSDGGVGPRV